MLRTWLSPDTRSYPEISQRSAALDLGRDMPRILLEARRIANTLSNGFHGRRQSGHGENFWQFRAFTSGEPSNRIDWRRSARDNRLYVREREFQSSHTFWLWVDRSISMRFSSSLAGISKIERAMVLGLALAHVLAVNAERVGLIGHTPVTGRNTIDRLAELMLLDKTGEKEDYPPSFSLPATHEMLLISDFLSPLEKLGTMLDTLSANKARGHALMILDPIEETFPFQGQAILNEPETHNSLKIGNAADWAEQYHIRMKSHQDQLKKMFSDKGWTFSVHHTDHPATTAATHSLSLIALSQRPSPQEL